jgi:hypothetical protein
VRTCFVSEQPLVAARGRKWVKRQIAFDYRGRFVRTARNLEAEDAAAIVDALLKVQGGRRDNGLD